MSSANGPHKSNLANEIDPRVDSTTGASTTDAAANQPYGADPSRTTVRPHSSNFANQLDPTVDSDLDHRAQYLPETTRTGNATSAAGSHATGAPVLGSTAPGSHATGAPVTGTASTGTHTTGAPVTGTTGTTSTRTTGAGTQPTSTTGTASTGGGGGLLQGIKGAAAQIHVRVTHPLVSTISVTSLCNLGRR